MRIGQFPFGEPITTVEQPDRTPKDVFVLGVYASAVHARWLSPEGKEMIKAVAVASEPEIFWRGEDAAEIIGRISVQPEAGRLEPAARTHNGPSGIALDELFLKPMRVDRTSAWVADLVPHSCMNPSQGKALRRSYEPFVAARILPAVDWPPVPSSLTDDNRRRGILEEIMASRASTLILLGDQPIKWFLEFFDRRWSRLLDFGETPQTYGRAHEVDLDGLEIDVLPLAHPRQAARLGASSKKWKELHESWIRRCSDETA